MKSHHNIIIVGSNRKSHNFLIESRRSYRCYYRSTVNIRKCYKLAFQGKDYELFYDQYIGRILQINKYEIAGNIPFTWHCYLFNKEMDYHKFLTE